VKLILDYWNRRWQSIAFDPACGEGRVRWFSRKPKHCSGWAANHEGHWYAVWLDGDDLVLQADSSRWRMNDVLQCRNVRHDTKRIFTVEQNGTTVLKVTYEAPLDQDDPAVDAFEIENVDFFSWVTRVCRDPGLKASLRNAWRKASVAA
jgi:hypothetical protein